MDLKFFVYYSFDNLAYNTIKRLISLNTNFLYCTNNIENSQQKTQKKEYGIQYFKHRI